MHKPDYETVALSHSTLDNNRYRRKKGRLKRPEWVLLWLLANQFAFERLANTAQLKYLGLLVLVIWR